MTKGKEETGLEIAVVGMAGRFPGARSVEELWKNLERGVESIMRFTDDELQAAGVPSAVLRDPNYVRAAGVLEGFDHFDASFFGYSPRESARMDPQQRIFLETAWAALEDAALVPRSFRGAIGVYAGSGMNAYLPDHVLRETPASLVSDLDYPTVLGNDKDFLATRVSYKLNLEGPSVVVQTACSTSLVAIHLACQALLSGECDAALAGGVSVRLPQIAGYLFQEEGIRSPDGHCRAFDEGALGSVPGSGAAAVVLKRLADALVAGDEIHAVVKGTAVNNDGGAKVGYTAPGVEGQARVVRAALDVAGTPAESIGYVEAHGTGTLLGDPIEVEALTAAFRDRTDGHAFCGIGSIKTNVGHLDAAAGVSGLIKAALCVKHGRIPPSLHYRKPNPRIDFAESPFFVVDTLREWGSLRGPRRAGVSSFGIGGTNAHAVLEQPPAFEGAAGEESSRPRLFVLSAKSGAALKRMRSRLADHVAERPGLDLSSVAHTLRRRRAELSHRSSFVAAGAEEMIASLRAPSEGRTTEADARVGFVFPGQGSQYVNMGRGLYETESVFRRHINEGADLLLPVLGLDLRRVLYPTDAGTQAAAVLDATEIAQPAIFLISFSLAKLWESAGVRPAAMLGHSIGEYVAACLAGVLTFPDALQLVAARGRLMGQAPPGAMLAVSLGPAELTRELDEDLELAAVNAPMLSVAAGPRDAIVRLEEKLRARGVDHRRLRTTHAFHTSAMDAVLDEFTRTVARVERSDPRVPYISNVTGTWATPGEARDPAYWASQIRKPVRFSNGHALLAGTVSVLLEVGPGRGLTSLARRSFQGTGPAAFASTRHADETRDDRRVWLEALSELWSRGVDVRWRADEDADRPRAVSLPTYPFEPERHWIDPGANQGAAPGEARLPRERWFSAPSWRRLVTGREDWRRRLDSAVSWIVFEDPHGVGADFASRLEAERQKVIRVSLGGRGFERIGGGRFSIPPDDGEAYRAFAEAIARPGSRPFHVVHFWNVEPEGVAVTGPDRLALLQSRGFESILYLTQALGAIDAASNCRLTIVTTQVQDVLGGEAICAEKALALGPIRVAPLEYPGCRATAVDILFPAPSGPARERLLDLLLATALDPASPPVLAIRGEHRWAQRFEPVAIERAAPSPLRDEGVYLITGGTGGIGLAIATHLARKGRAKLILTGTTPLPERGDWESWVATSEEGDFQALLGPLGAADAAIVAECGVKPMTSYEGLEASLDALTTAYALQLVGSAVEPSAPDGIEIEDLKRRLGIVESLSPYFDMLLRALCQDGFAVTAGGRLQLVVPRSEWPIPEKLGNRLRARYPDFLPVVSLLVHCLSRLDPVLRGEEEALGVLYGEGRDLFRAGVANILDHSHAAACQPLLREIVSRLAARERGRPLRVLEVGGGEGIMTEALVPVLERARVEYVFTDVSKSFVVQAEKKAAESERGFMRFGRLDISRPPIPQGFAAGQFDLVAGFNVVHATPRIDVTLAHLRELLAPGGLLVLQESVRPRRWVDAVWGLTEGWWLFEDRDLRTSSPLIDLERWERALSGAAFHGVASFPRADAARELVDSGIILGQKPGAAEERADTETSIRSRIRKLLAIENLGAEVAVACVDAADRAGMEKTVRDAEARFGRIDGVIHAALVLDDGPMQLKTRESFERVFAPKVRGTLVLEEILRDRALDFFAMFSSLVSILGGKGQVDYCAASNFQDAFAHQHRGKLAKTVVAIDWAAWSETGKAAREALARGARLGEVLPEGISTEEGIESFLTALASSLPQVLVSPVALLDPAASALPAAGVGQTDPSARSHRDVAESHVAADAPETAAERALAAIWRDLLGLERIGLRDNFFELGADSVVSLQFIARARKEGFQFTNAQVFEYQTIADLLRSENANAGET